MNRAPRVLYRAALVGAGRIAAGYDAPGDGRILTHAHALGAQDRVRCSGLYDPDPDRALAAGAKWNLPVAPTLEALLAGRPEIVIVAAPDDAHLDCLERVLQFAPRLVLCEKPLTRSVSDSERIIARYERSGVPLAVNYQRRFDPIVSALKARLDCGASGRPLAATVLYSKGVLHNGSHAVDLLRYLFGEVRAAQGRRKVHDFLPGDPSVSGTLRFDALEAEMVALDERAYSVFEIDLLFEHERTRFAHSGLRYQRQSVRPDPVFAGHRELVDEESGPTGLAGALRDMILAMADFLDAAGALRNSARDALETQRVCARLLESAP